MSTPARMAIVVSAGSGIGTAICAHWRERGWQVCGTYRTPSGDTDSLQKAGVRLIQCEMADAKSVSKACDLLRDVCPVWDVLVVCTGTLEPVGLFADQDFDEWEQSLQVNLLAQLRVVHELLPTRRPAGNRSPCVLFFAGGGTNSAPVRYSAYTLSKISLIKMCELLDAEMPDVRFMIVGPGWVRTKIHCATLEAAEQAGGNFEETVARFESGNFVNLSEVVECCDWLVDVPREVMGGRNLSLAHDKWRDERLKHALLEQPEMYKLRRSGNEWPAIQQETETTHGRSDEH
jgi:NAD(P)-dependent dehydrogenase (short-subunit alcohol dehydrogenase family)